VLDTRTARLAAADLLSRRAWTRRELATRLRRRGAPPEIATEVVDDMAARGYVDDADFARHWVESRTKRGYGAGRLRAELRARGVAPPVIDRALAPVTSDRTLVAARAVAARRLPVLARGAPDRLAHRLSDYLMRRGFDGSVVSRVVRDMTGPAGRSRT
jgi:regulatory protein